MTTPPRPRRRVLHLITRLIVGGAQENTLASVVRVAPDRYDSQLWIGPQAGSEGTLLDEARALGTDPVVIPDLVREISPLRDLRATRDLTRRLRNERFDLIHTHSSKAGILGRIAARRAGVPVVVHTAHGWGFHERMPAWRQRAYITAERVLARGTDCIVSVSHQTTRIGLDAGIGQAADYEMIRSGIPLDRFRPDPDARARVRQSLGIPADAPVVGSVGRLSAQKNPEDFVELARRTASRIPGVRFLYVGDGPLRPRIEERIRREDLEDVVILAGLRRDVPGLLAAMDVFVLTSLWEGLPRVVPQALATGVPTVVYDISGIREIVRDTENGWLVSQGDLESMEGHVVGLLSNPERLSAMGARARDQFDSAFSEIEMIRRLEALYDRLLGETPGT